MMLTALSKGLLFTGVLMIAGTFVLVGLSYLIDLAAAGIRKLLRWPPQPEQESWWPFQQNDAPPYKGAHRPPRRRR